MAWPLGKLKVVSGAIESHNDGRMRALPKDRGKWKHGVYYHLAYWGPVAKQAMNVVPPKRVAGEFK